MAHHPLPSKVGIRRELDEMDTWLSGVGLLCGVSNLCTHTPACTPNFPGADSPLCEEKEQLRIARGDHLPEGLNCGNYFRES